MGIIEIDNISKKFKNSQGKEFYALKDTSLSIDEGEIFSILGPNGAGKTTLLNIIMGITLPDTGKVKVMGLEPGNLSVMERMGFVSGEERFHWSLTCHDILKFGTIVFGIKDGEERIKELIKLLGLTRAFNTKFEVMSTGEKIKMALAYGLLNRPTILILDEPTLGLDPDISVTVRNKIKDINKKEKTTILMTSHYMHEVEYLSSKVAFLNKGRIKEVDSVEGIKNRYPNLEKYFIGMVKDEA